MGTATRHRARELRPSRAARPRRVVSESGCCPRDPVVVFVAAAVGRRSREINQGKGSSMRRLTRRKTPTEELKDAAIKALVNALDDDKRAAKSGMKGVRALAAGAVIYTAGHAAFKGQRFVREQLSSDTEDDQAEDLEDEEETRAYEEPQAEESDVDEEDDEPEAVEDEDDDEPEAVEDDERARGRRGRRRARGVRGRRRRARRGRGHGRRRARRERPRAVRRRAGGAPGRRGLGGARGPAGA